jgi:hypothetical protein
LYVCLCVRSLSIYAYASLVCKQMHVINTGTYYAALQAEGVVVSAAMGGPVCIYTCMYVCTHVCRYICVCMHFSVTYLHGCLHTSMHADCAVVVRGEAHHACTIEHTCVFSACLCVCVCVCVYVCLCMQCYSCMHVGMLVYRNNYTYLH